MMMGSIIIRAPRKTRATMSQPRDSRGMDRDRCLSSHSGFDPTGRVPIAQHAARVDASLQAPKIMICGSPTKSARAALVTCQCHSHTHTRFLSASITGTLNRRLIVLAAGFLPNLEKRLARRLGHVAKQL